MAKQTRQQAAWEETVAAHTERAPEGYVPECDRAGFRRLDWFKFWGRSWHTSATRRELSAVARAVYFELLILDSVEGSIPRDARAVGASCALEARLVRAHYARVAQHFLLLSDGRIVSKRGEEARKKRRFDRERKRGREEERKREDSRAGFSDDDASTGEPPPPEGLEEFGQRAALVERLQFELGLGTEKAWRALDRWGHTTEDLDAWVAFRQEHGSKLATHWVQRAKNPADAEYAGKPKRGRFAWVREESEES